MRIVFAGGGTGGHLFPGISVAEELRRRHPDARLLFLVTERDRSHITRLQQGIEAVVVPSQGTGPLPKRLARLVPGMAHAFHLLRQFRPDVLVGLGGYGSLAPVATARLLRVPCVLLEQNVVPGRTNRLLERFVAEVECQWEESASFFHNRSKVRVTGNPIRSGIARRDRAAAAAELGIDPAKPTLLVMGGSQGATPLNEAVFGALPVFAEQRAPIQFVHLTGQADVERARAVYESFSLPAAVLGFLGDMSRAYSVADLAVSRAGGTSIAELTALGIPSILIPYPFATDNHQYLNARVLEYHGAALLIEQAALTPARLARRVIELLTNPARLAYMGRQSRLFGVPRAASVVADRLEALS